MNNKIQKPNIPLKEIHEILSIEMEDFQYLVIALDKKERGKKEQHIHAMSNFSKEELLEIVTDMKQQIEESTAYISLQDEKDFEKGKH